MDDLLEMILDFVLDGLLEVAGSQRAPLVLRILAGAVILLFYGGLLVLSVMLMVSGLRSADTALTLVGLVMVLLFLAAGWFLFRKIRNR